MKRDADVRVLRVNVVIYTSKVSSLRRFKDDVNEVRSGFECGIGIANFNDVKVGDLLECFKIEKSSPLEAVAAAAERSRGAAEGAEARRN
jgi:translation initiation factor IF-2